MLMLVLVVDIINLEEGEVCPSDIHITPFNQLFIFLFCKLPCMSP
jgi:hypothetical protein